MEETVGESVARRLVAWGVDTVFGLPGDGINGLMEGFRRCREDLRFVLVHHEEAAAFMATGYAKATGRLGDAGCRAMKIKVAQAWGTDRERDLHRVEQLAALAGDGVRLMVDANGGYGRAAARQMGAAFDGLGVTWFEEPVTSDDLAGLAAVRGAVRCEVAAGEYVSTPYDAAALCPVVDCLQLDVTRCGGYTGWRACAAVAAAHGLEVSAHCAPSLHAPLVPAVPNVRDVEWFADHARLEPALVDGAPPVEDGHLVVRDDVVGHGMRLREA